MPERLTVFISSTSKDLEEHRQQVRDACLELEMFPKMMEHLAASTAGAVEVSLGMVDQADIYVGIFAYRYGYIPDGYDRSITQMEYERAVERKLPCLIFIMGPTHLIQAENVETGEGAVKMQAFKEHLTRTHVVNFFSSPADLRGQALHSLAEQKAKMEQAAQGSAPGLGGITVNQTATGSKNVTQIGYVQGQVNITQNDGDS